jgi:hypothetical protein
MLTTPLRYHPLIDNEKIFAPFLVYYLKVGLSDGGETHPEHGCYRPQHDQVTGKLSGRNSDIFAKG